MNRCYLISYKVKRLDEFVNLIKTFGPWYKFDENSFLITSLLDVTEINSRLNALFDVNVDRLLIVEINVRNYKGWQTKEIWDWFQTQTSGLQ